MNPKFHRLPPSQRLARAVSLRSKRVRVVTRDGQTYQGVLLAVGLALHGTSADWLAIAHSPMDRFVSLATIVSIERTPEAAPSPPLTGRHNPRHGATVDQSLPRRMRRDV
jgi:hypothetical protein